MIATAHAHQLVELGGGWRGRDRGNGLVFVEPGLKFGFVKHAAGAALLRCAIVAAASDKQAASGLAIGP